MAGLLAKRLGAKKVITLIARSAYAELVGDANAGERLLAYARAVYDAAAPTLMA